MVVGLKLRLNNNIEINEHEINADITSLADTPRIMTKLISNITGIPVKKLQEFIVDENGKVIGRATGGDFGFRLNKSIALGMVKPELANVGQKLKIDIFQDQPLIFFYQIDHFFFPLCFPLYSHCAFRS